MVHSAIDEKGWGGHVGSDTGRPGFPTAEPAFSKGDSSRDRVREATRSSILLRAGADRSTVRARRDRDCSRRTGTPEALDDWLVPACYQ